MGRNGRGGRPDLRQRGRDPGQVRRDITHYALRITHFMHYTCITLDALQGRPRAAEVVRAGE